MLKYTGSGRSLILSFHSTLSYFYLHSTPISYFRAYIFTLYVLLTLSCFRRTSVLLCVVLITGETLMRVSRRLRPSFDGTGRLSTVQSTVNREVGSSPHGNGTVTVWRRRLNRQVRLRCPALRTQLRVSFTYTIISITVVTVVPNWDWFYQGCTGLGIPDVNPVS